MLDRSLQGAQEGVSAGTRRRALTVMGTLALLVCCLLVPIHSIAQQVAKTIEGKVLNTAAAPLPGSIIYLQDQKTDIIKTLIATSDGSYRFGQLPADTDYKLWAEYKGKKSKVRLISSFDTKLDVTYDFHISE